ncbi:hypothetical protein ACWEBX_17235 [Streptomyces sp. NPDC005070]
MAIDDVAPRNRARLTRGGSPSRLARDLLRTEYGRRNRERGWTGPADADGIWERLVAELRRLLRTFTGGSRSAPGGGGSGPASGGGGPVSGGGQDDGQETGPGVGRDGGQETGQGGGRRPGPEGPVHAGPSGLALLEQRVLRLPTHEREAFEDAVLDLVRNNRKYREAFEQSPESMPLVARWAANAYERELAREAPPASVPSGQDPAGRRPDEPARSEGERPARDRAVPAIAPSVLDLPSRAASPFLSIPEFPLTTPESPLMLPESPLTSQASLLTDPADGLSPLPYLASPVSPLPYLASPVSPLLSQTAPVSPLLSQTTPVSPLLEQAAPVSPPLGSAAVASPISGDGHRVLSDSLDALSRSSAPRSPGSSSRPGTFRPPPATQNTSAPPTPRRV